MIRTNNDFHIHFHGKTRMSSLVIHNPVAGAEEKQDPTSRSKTRCRFVPLRLQGVQGTGFLGKNNDGKSISS
jgi:hypothetical protein